MVKEILAVEKRDRALHLGFRKHGAKITPPGPCGKSDGEEVVTLLS